MSDQAIKEQNEEEPEVEPKDKKAPKLNIKPPGERFAHRGVTKRG